MAKNVKNKKDVFPSKTTINLYFKEDTSNRSSTVFLYVLFGLVVALALVKFLGYDMVMKLNTIEKNYEKQQEILAEHLLKLEDFDEIISEYNRYSDKHLKEDEIFCDRMEILKMLEETILKEAYIETFSAYDNKVSVNFNGPDLEETAALARKIESYDIVQSVEVNTASYEDRYSVRMVITVTEKVGGAK